MGLALGLGLGLGLSLGLGLGLGLEDKGGPGCLTLLPLSPTAHSACLGQSAPFLAPLWPRCMAAHIGPALVTGPRGQTGIRSPLRGAIQPGSEDIPPKMRRYGLGTISLSIFLVTGERVRGQLPERRWHNCPLGDARGRHRRGSHASRVTTVEARARTAVYGVRSQQSFFSLFASLVPACAAVYCGAR